MTKVELVDWSTNGKATTLATLNKLISKAEWAKTVTSLRVGEYWTAPYPPRESRFPFREFLLALGKTRSLIAITIEGIIFKNAEEQAQLLQTIQMHTPRLEQLRWRPIGDNRAFPRPEFNLSGIRLVEWSAEEDSYGGHGYVPALPTLLDGSKATLRHLNLPHIHINTEENHYLWDYRFPNLRTLRVKAAYEPDLKWPQRVTDFIADHSATLERVTLDVDAEVEGEDIGASTCHFALRANSFQAPYTLRKFAGELNILEKNARASWSELKFDQLEYLTILSGFYENVECDPVSRLERFIEPFTRDAPAFFDHLRSLSLEFMFNWEEVKTNIEKYNYNGERLGEDADGDPSSDSLNSGSIFRLLATFGALCGKRLGSLSIIISKRPKRPKPFKLADILPPLRLFPKLKTLDLPDFAPEAGKGAHLAVEKYIIALARECPELSVVKLVSRMGSGQCYHISRSSGNEPVVRMTPPTASSRVTILRKCPQ